MKKTALIPAVITDAALVFCGVFASLSMAPTTYSIPFDVGMLAAAAAVSSLLLALWFDIKRGGLIFGALFMIALAALGIIWRKQISEGAGVAVYRILGTVFNSGEFAAKAESFVNEFRPEESVTRFLMISSGILAFLLSLFAVKWKKLVPSLLIPLPFLVISLVYTNLRPAVWCILLLLLYIGGLLLGFGIRKRDPEKGGRFMAVILPVLLALCFGMTVVSPEKSYEPIPYEQRRDMFGKRFGELRDQILGIYSQNPSVYDLSGEDERIENEDRLFIVSASRRGSYHLRTHSYGAYSEGKWLAAEEYPGEFSSAEMLGSGKKIATATISIFGSLTNERYVPYGVFAQDNVSMGESFVRAMGETSYSWEFGTGINYYYAVRPNSKEEEAYLEFAREQYTMPDGPEKQALREITEQANIYGAADYFTALQVADLVKRSGYYSLTPGKTPAGEDFVLYFLKESHVGYCVHFAAATTALLQAMDIPARYTVGCCITVPDAGQWYEVPKKAMHAWTEVYIRNVGWVPIESTPGFSDDSADNEGELTTPIPAASTPVPSAVPTEPSVTEPAGTRAPDSKPERSEEAEMTLRPRPPKPNETDLPSGPSGHGGGAGWYGAGDGIGYGIPLPAIIIPAFIILWFVTGSLLRKHRERSFRQKDARKAVIKILRYHVLLEKLFHISRSPELDELQDEAAFSNHDMTKQRDDLLDYLDEARREIAMGSASRWIVFRRLLFVL